jgi:hypothetical protein
MAAHTSVGVGYNIQIAVDAKNKMIVVTNQVVDMGLLAPAPAEIPFTGTSAIVAAIWARLAQASAGGGQRIG